MLGQNTNVGVQTKRRCRMPGSQPVDGCLIEEAEGLGHELDVIVAERPEERFPRAGIEEVGALVMEQPWPAGHGGMDSHRSVSVQSDSV